MEHQQSHFDSSRDSISCSDPAQIYGVPQDSPSSFQNSGFPFVPKIHDSYQETLSSYNGDSIGITPAQSSLSLATPSCSSPLWPSMLTNTTNLTTTPIAMVQPSSLSVSGLGNNYPIPLPVLQSKKEIKRGGSSSTRKTLTDDERIKICQYKVDNPKVKQTEIGAIFGVERSTVSKVLRLKEKYLKLGAAASNQAKQTKKKPTEVKQSVTNWLCYRDKKGFNPTNNLMKKQDGYSGIGSHQENFTKIKRSRCRGRAIQRNKLEGRKMSFDQISSQSRSEVPSTSSSWPPSANSLNFYRSSIDNSSLISAHSSNSSPVPEFSKQPRRQTFPSLETTYPSFYTQSFEDVTRNFVSHSDASLSMDSPGNDFMSPYSNDNQIYSLPSSDGDSLGCFSSYSMMEHADHQSLSESPVPELKESKVESLVTFGFLLDQYGKQNGESINGAEYFSYFRPEEQISPLQNNLQIFQNEIGQPDWNMNM